MNIRIGRISRLLTPGMGWCLRCGTTWSFVAYHDTNYWQGSGCFPLCETCWHGLSIEQRLPYYRQLVESWFSESKPTLNGNTFQQTWDHVEEAVREGR